MNTVWKRCAPIHKAQITSRRVSFLSGGEQRNRDYIDDTGILVKGLETLMREKQKVHVGDGEGGTIYTL